jgi:hypothetical protein
MKKIGAFIFILLVFSCVLVYAQSETTDNVNKYAEITGESLLKFQELLIGALAFLSFGAFGQGGTFAFAQFLFMIVTFMFIYSVVGFVPFFSSKFQFPISLIITILAFLTIDVQEIQLMLSTYESMGIAITVILPVLILLAFTFRIYQRAYEGKSNKSPFYAELFNLIFLVFFGIFFIRYSKSEEGSIALFRLISGWVLIGFGIGQTVAYKLLVGLFHKWRAESTKYQKELKKLKEDAVDKAKEEEFKSL